MFCVKTTPNHSNPAMRTLLRKIYKSDCSMNHQIKQGPCLLIKCLKKISLYQNTTTIWTEKKFCTDVVACYCGDSYFVILAHLMDAGYPVNYREDTIG